MDESSRAQWERAHGAFVLVIGSLPSDDASWKLLRKALRLSRADEEWLRERVPGVVRRGAREDMERAAQRVREAGYQVSVVARDAG